MHDYGLLAKVCPLSFTEITEELNSMRKCGNCRQYAWQCVISVLLYVSIINRYFAKSVKHDRS